MDKKLEPGLGELLRHLTDLVDSGAHADYRARGVAYRPRYTPIMRVLADGARPVGEIVAQLSITQGAVSQTLKRMEEDGLIVRRAGRDARKTIVTLTKSGRRLLTVLEPHWQGTFRAVEALEKEVGAPIRSVLATTIAALAKVGFDKRIADAERGRRGARKK
ncbi:MAG: MarR family transcriptional regulator [Gammaproteobacteria bacterium]